jgi:hypothetical protein
MADSRRWEPSDCVLRRAFVHRAAGPCPKLFALLYRNPFTGQWLRARHVATRKETAKSNAEWEIIGPSEIHDVDAGAQYFTPFRVTPHSEAMRRFDRRPR